MIRADDPETGWLVRIAVTALMVWALLSYPGADVPWVRPVLIASFACWLGFLAADLRFPVAGRVALAAASVLPATVTALPHNGSAHLFLFGALFTFVLMPRVPLWAILTVSGLIVVVQLIGVWLGGLGAVALLTQPALILVLLLFSLHRREHRLRAEQTEMLLEQTRHTQQAQARAAALDERARIARELHDVLAHSLGALGVQLEVAEAQLTERGDVDGAAERIRRARRLAADGMAEARSAVAALREDVPPLSRALDDLAAAHRANHATTVTLRTDGAVRPLPSGAEVSLLRTAREALTNAARHAPGAPVTLRLEYRRTSARLTVSNPALSGPSPGGYGLTGARERIALVGGTLEAGVTGDEWLLIAEVPG